MQSIRDDALCDRAGSARASVDLSRAPEASLHKGVESSANLRALLLFAMSVIVPPAATALPLTPFRYEAQAQRHCPGDTVVWLDFRKEVYYLKRQKRYGQGSTGSFVCQKEARAGRFRRSLLGIR